MKKPNLIQKEESAIKAMLIDDFADRTPLLSSLIDKWKFFVKTKKIMLDKYIKNSEVVETAIQKMVTFLGLDQTDQLPYILEKMLSQMDSIEKFMAQLSEEQNLLEFEKNALEKKIAEMKVKSLIYIKDQTTKSNKNKLTFTQTKTHNILKLKQLIKEM